MCRSRYLIVCTLCLTTVSVLLPRTIHADSQPAQAPPSARQKVSPVTQPDDEHRATAGMLLQQIWPNGPGRPEFAKIDTVVKACDQTDVATRNAVIWLALTYMKDESREADDRWPCCYVISGCKYDQGVPDLIDVMLHDPVEVMRAVSAEALGMMYLYSHDTAILDALCQAAHTDTSKRVLKVIAKYRSWWRSG